MASIYRREKSRVWQCAFYLPTPERARKVRRSTAKTNRREAERIAATLERDGVGVSESKAQKVHGILAAADEDALKEKLTVFKARAYLAQILKASSGEEVTSFTVRSWAEEWLARKTKTVGIATRKRYTVSVRCLLEWLGEDTEKPLESITTTTVRAFRDHLQMADGWPGRARRN